tara:strand:- start:6008 stop:8368 length:2361 start_codon:yes stop_codon:yes gene_type:complete
MKFKLLEEQGALSTTMATKHIGDAAMSPGEVFAAQKAIPGGRGREKFTDKAWEQSNIDAITVGRLADPEGGAEGYDYEKEGITQAERAQLEDSLESHAARQMTDQSGNPKYINVSTQYNYITPSGKKIPYVIDPKKTTALPEDKYDWQFTGLTRKIPRTGGRKGTLAFRQELEEMPDEVSDYLDKYTPAILARKLYSPSAQGDWRDATKPISVDVSVPGYGDVTIQVRNQEPEGQDQAKAEFDKAKQRFTAGQVEFEKDKVAAQPKILKFKERTPRPPKAKGAAPKPESDFAYGARAILNPKNKGKGYEQASYTYGTGPEVTIEDRGDFLNTFGSKLVAKLPLKPSMTIDKGYWAALHGAAKELEGPGHKVPSDYNEETVSLREEALKSLAQKQNVEREEALKQWRLSKDPDAKYPGAQVKTFTREDIAGEILKVAEDRFHQKRLGQVEDHLRKTGGNDLDSFDRQTGYMSDDQGHVLGPNGKPLFNRSIKGVFERAYGIIDKNNERQAAKGIDPNKIPREHILWVTFTGSGAWKDLTKTQDPEQLKQYFSRFDPNRSEGVEGRPENGLAEIVRRLGLLPGERDVKPLPEPEPGPEPKKPRYAEEVGVIPSEFYAKRVAGIADLPGGVQVTVGPGAAEYTEEEGPLRTEVGQEQLTKQRAATLAQGFVSIGRSALRSSTGRNSRSYKKAKASLVLASYPINTVLNYNRRTRQYELSSIDKRESTAEEKADFLKMYKQMNPTQFLDQYDKLQKESVHREEELITFNKRVSRKNTLLKEFKILIKREE